MKSKYIKNAVDLKLPYPALAVRAQHFPGFASDGIFYILYIYNFLNGKLCMI